MQRMVGRTTMPPDVPLCERFEDWHERVERVLSNYNLPSPNPEDTRRCQN
jgi:hypothetical protein